MQKKYFSYLKVDVLEVFRFRILTWKQLDPNHSSKFEKLSIKSMIGSPNDMIRQSIGMDSILLKNLRLKFAFAVKLKSSMFEKFLYF